MDKRSHNSSRAEEQYEEEIYNLKAQIKSMQFQISDLKNFIINQKKLHAKEVEQLKNSFENTLQQTMMKNNRETETLKAQMKQNQQTSSHEQKSLIFKQLSNINEVTNQLSKKIQKDLNIKLQGLFKKVIDCQHKLTLWSNQKLSQQYDKKIYILALKKEIADKHTLLQRQRNFMDRMIQEKNQSDKMYQKQLSFLEEVYRQRIKMCNRLEKVNSQLQTENNSIRQQIANRRRTDGASHQTVCIHLDEDQQFVRRISKACSQTTQPTQRKTPKPQKRSVMKDEQYSAKSQQSPLKPFRTNQVQSMNSPPNKFQKAEYSIAKNGVKSTTCFGKRLHTKTLDPTKSQQLNGRALKIAREKENIEQI